MTAVPDWDIASDADLVGAALSGDRAAFAGIYDRYADRLHDYCVGMVRDREAAADCVQDVFCTAATALNTLREPDRLRPWLYAIARNEALRRIRQRRREEPSEELPEEASGEAGPDTLAARNELAKLVAEAAGGLSDRDRSVLELGYRHGLEGPELAEALGVSAASANKIMQRLRDTMERSLGALLVARRGQADDTCAELSAILAGWDGTFTILMRKRIARHIENCPVCDQDRRRLVNPVALLGGAPLFIPAPAWLRDRTLSQVQLTSASENLSGAPTQARNALPDATTDQFAALDSAATDEEPPAAQPAGRVMLTMSLLVGIPLIVLALTIAWRYETNAPVTPQGVISSVTPSPSRPPETPVSMTVPPPQPSAPTAVVTAPAEPTVIRPSRTVPPPQQSPAPPPPPVVAPEPPPLPLPPPRHHRPPVITEEPSPSQAPPIVTEPPPSPTPPPAPAPSGTPRPPRPRPPIPVGPVEPAPVTTTQPPIIN